MKLHEVSWSIYPRRVGIYLMEKGLDGIERIETALPRDMSRRILEDVTPAGTVPALDTGTGTIIGSSIAIMEYLEERFPTPTLLGDTPEERARTREFIFVIEEASSLMGLWVHNGSQLFNGREPQDKGAARAAMEAYHAKLRLLDRMATKVGGEFLAGNRVTIPDCITFSTLQTGKEQFGAPIPEGCPFLEGWYERFAQRPSGATPAYPPILHMTRGLVEQTFAP